MDGWIDARECACVYTGVAKCCEGISHGEIVFCPRDSGIRVYKCLMFARRIVRLCNNGCYGTTIE